MSSALGTLRHFIFTSAAALALLYSAGASASLIQGFENGGWEFVGDFSIQTDVIGAPSQGSRQAFITTLCDAEVVGWCETTSRELPYTGISGLPATEAGQFLGLKLGETGHFEDELPYPPYNGIMGESGAMKGRFYATAGSELLFDWRHYMQGGEGDSSYFTLWGDDPASDFRVTDYLRYGYEGFASARYPSSIDLCRRTLSGNVTFCDTNPTYDTGYRTRSVLLPRDGWYWVGFAMFEAEEGTVGSALSIDNIRLEARAVSEPSTIALFCLALVGYGVLRRRTLRSHAGSQRLGPSDPS